MSQSGIPVVSQTAKATSTIVNSVGDIFKGKNVFEAIGRIATAPIAASQAQLDQITFGKLRGVPIIGEQMRTSGEFLDNPYDKGAATRWGQGEAKLGATVAATIFTGGAAAGALGTSSAVGYGATALAANKIVNGGSVVDALTPFAGPVLDPYLGQFSDLKSSLGQFASNSSKPPNYTQSSFSSPSQVLPVQSSGMNGVTIMLLAVGAASLYFIYKGVK